MFFPYRHNDPTIFVENKDILNLFYQEYKTGKKNKNHSFQRREDFRRDQFFGPIISYICSVSCGLNYLMKKSDRSHERHFRNGQSSKESPSDLFQRKIIADLSNSYHIKSVQRLSSIARRIQQLQRRGIESESYLKLQKCGPWEHLWQAARAVSKWKSVVRA